MRLTGWLFGAAMMLGASLQAQDQPAPRRDPAIELVVADAASLAPEFNADVLIRRVPAPQ